MYLLSQSLYGLKLQPPKVNHNLIGGLRDSSRTKLQLTVVPPIRYKGITCGKKCKQTISVPLRSSLQQTVTVRTVLDRSSKECYCRSNGCWWCIDSSGGGKGEKSNVKKDGKCRDAVNCKLIKPHSALHVTVMPAVRIPCTETRS